MDLSSVLKVENRTQTGKSEMKKLRRTGFLPATICSKEIDSVMVSIKRDIVSKISKGGKTAVLKMQTNDEKTYNVMLKDIQVAPVTGEYMHVVFQQVSLTTKTKAVVPLKITGKDFVEARRLNFLQQFDSLPVSGLPNDIPSCIDIDVSNMQAGDKLYINDLVVPEDVTIEVDPELLVASVSEPRGHAEEIPLDEKAIEEKEPQV